MDSDLQKTKSDILSLVETAFDQRILSTDDFVRYAKPIEDEKHPDFVRKDLESWYRNLGIESIIHRKFSLSPCPFTREEIEEAHKNEELILCVPAGITCSELSKLFRIDSWAIHDPLVLFTVETRDFWFKTSIKLHPDYINVKGIEVRRIFAEENKIQFNLERYLTFIARMQYCTKQTPDFQYWIWLSHKSYDRSGMLIAGFDRNGSFSVHGWMPHFSASFLGARYGYAPRSK